MDLDSDPVSSFWGSAILLALFAAEVISAKRKPPDR